MPLLRRRRLNLWTDLSTEDTPRKLYLQPWNKQDESLGELLSLGHLEQRSVTEDCVSSLTSIQEPSQTTEKPSVTSTGNSWRIHSVWKESDFSAILASQPYHQSSLLGSQAVSDPHWALFLNEHKTKTGKVHFKCYMYPFPNLI